MQLTNVQGNPQKGILCELAPFMALAFGQEGPGDFLRPFRLYKGNSAIVCKTPTADRHFGRNFTLIFQ
jgi:hypothetical protein